MRIKILRNEFTKVTIRLKQPVDYQLDPMLFSHVISRLVGLMSLSHHIDVGPYHVNESGVPGDQDGNG